MKQNPSTGQELQIAENEMNWDEEFEETAEKAVESGSAGNVITRGVNAISQIGDKIDDSITAVKSVINTLPLQIDGNQIPDRPFENSGLKRALDNFGLHSSSFVQ
ncbi:hypothetical protein ACF0H5_010007 [Mactra antiquata]